MKRIFAVIFVLCLLLAACGSPAQTEPVETTTAPTTAVTTEPTTVPTTQPTTVPTKPETEPTTEPTTVPTEPPVVYRNPLNGEILEQPYDGRVFAVTINNVKAALPHHGVSQADIFFEMFVNDYCTRGLAMFTDVAQVKSIGSIRSARYNFTDLCQAYNAVLVHASGSDGVLSDLRASGVDNMNADSSIGYRDNDRYKYQGYSWEHTLFARGQELLDAAAKKGFALNAAGKDYGMQFTGDGTPAGGESASEIEIVFSLKGHTKSTTMRYDPETGKYVFRQFGKEMVDENNGQTVAFENVIVILAEVENQGVYHVAELTGRGSGYFACNGQVVPITWVHEYEDAPILFFLSDGTPLYQGVGSTYVAIAPTGSPVNYS